MGTITTFPAVTPAVPNNGTYLAYAQIVANQNANAGDNTDKDVVGLSVTFNVPAGRRIRATAFCILQQRTSSGLNWLFIREGATSLTEDLMATVAIDGYWSPHPSVILTPSAGVHTYKVTVRSSAGTVDVNAGTGFPAYLLVEDITNDAQPYPPASVPVGMLAYAEVPAGTNITGFGNPPTNVGPLSVNVVVPAGRTLRITAQAILAASTAVDQLNIKIYEGVTQLAEGPLTQTSAGRGYEQRAMYVTSPSAGAHTYNVKVGADTGTPTVTLYGTAFILVEDITATPAPANSAPSSTLGYAQAVANQALSVSNTDLTGLSVTVTVPAGRRIRVRGYGEIQNTYAGDNWVALRIFEGATQLVEHAVNTAATGGNAQYATSTPEVILTPSAGVHTYKLVGLTGSGGANLLAGATSPAWILVEDITAVSTYAINPLAIQPGAFQAGIYNIPDQLVVGGGDAPWDIYHRLTLVAPLSVQDINFTFKKQGAPSASNIYWMLSRYAGDQFEIRGWDGTTAKGFMYLDYPNGRIFLQDKPLCLRNAGDTNHNIKYVSSYAGVGLDGPIIIGNASVCLADINNWMFRGDTSGDCWSRRDLRAGGWVYSDGITTNSRLGNGSTYGNSVSAHGQHKGFAQNRMHFSTDGNDSHINWDGTYRFWVDSTNVKNFVIPHPLDNERYLIHACIEAPEALVQYRGQARLENGWVEITLPAYFEALCAEEGRSVQLTAIADDPQDEWCPVLHATYPKNGKFWVGLGSGLVVNDQRFWWEVKAVRKDVPPVNVEPLTDTVDVLGQGPYTYYKEK